MKKALRQLLLFFKGLPLTESIMAAFSKLGGIKGWLLSLIVKPVIKGVENAVDGAIDDYVATSDSDEKIEKKKIENVKKQTEAKTDEEFDRAADDSFR